MASIFGKLKRKQNEDTKDAKVLDSTDDIKTEKKVSKVEEAKKDKDSVSTKKQINIPAKSRSFEVLVRPHISEKSAYGEERGIYVFVVKKNANKVEIKNAINDVYGIMPKKVHVVHMDGKHVRSGAKQGQRKDWKKAMVTLPKGKNIDIHAGV